MDIGRIFIKRGERLANTCCKLFKINYIRFLFWALNNPRKYLIIQYLRGFSYIAIVIYHLILTHYTGGFGA